MHTIHVNTNRMLASSSEVVLHEAGSVTLSSCASAPGLPALEELHALADRHSAALSRRLKDL